MKCAEARTFLQLYLDSELDPAKSLEVGRHLETCEECAGLFEAEKRLNTRVVACLRAKQQPTPQLWSKIETSIRRASGAGAIKKRRRLVAWLLPMVTMIALLAMLAGGFSIWHGSPVELAVAAIQCHRNILQADNAANPGQIGADAGELRSAGGRIDSGAFQYRPTARGFEFSGADLDDIASVPAAAIRGRYHAVPVSFFVLKIEELVHFPEARRRLESGESVVCCRSGGFEFAARKINGHVICAIADMPRPQLENLLSSMTNRAAITGPKV